MHALCSNYLSNSTVVPKAWPGTPFWNLTLTTPFLPWDPAIFPMSLLFPCFQTTFLLISWHASEAEFTCAKWIRHSLGFCVPMPIL